MCESPKLVKRFKAVNYRVQRGVADWSNAKFGLGRGGHVDSGKSTTTGRLIFELGGLPERELEKLKAEADRLGHLAIQ